MAAVVIGDGVWYHLFMEGKRRIFRRIMVALCLLLVVILVAGVVAGNFFVELALNPHSDKTRVLEADHNEVDYGGDDALDVWHDNLAWMDDTGYTLLGITSRDGLALSAYCMENADPAANWVVIAHGYNGYGRQMVAYARAFYERGWNVLMPDARACGKSEGTYLGVGWQDRLDHLDWINEMNALYAPRNVVLFGVSMGGATVLMTAGEAMSDNVRAVVSDCAYTSAWDEFSYQLKGVYGMPAFPLMHFSSLMARIKAGYWLGSADTLAQVEKAGVPILFIHGAGDTFVPAKMVHQLYDAAPTEKELLVVEGAGHGGAATTDPELYWNTVDAFLARYLAP